MDYKLFKTDIKKREDWTYKVFKGGIIIAEGIHNSSQDVVGFLPRDISKSIETFWDLYDFSLSNEGWVVGQLKSYLKTIGGK